ncbi:hypothetical protein [Gemmata sp.]|uniref:hypothetical protein n=1 Tax=Gemmata sp. TaxID=1914242 RepID=UPI003F71C82D
MGVPGAGVARHVNHLHAAKIDAASTHITSHGGQSVGGMVHPGGGTADDRGE